MNPAREWRCDACPAIEIQTGPRALEMLPSPPDDWTVVDTTKVLPPRLVGDGAAKVKVGAIRETIRKTYCATCTIARKERGA